MHFGTFTPAQRVFLDAATARQALASQWLSAAQVSQGLGSHAPSGSHLVSRLRRAGKLLGAYVTRPSPRYRYPAWQFLPSGQPVDHLAEILALLREFGPFARELGGLRRSTYWGEVEWFLSPHATLDGAAPSQILAAAPCRVLRAACMEFQGDA